MDTDTVVVASVVREGRNVDVHISELLDLYGDIGPGFFGVWCYVGYAGLVWSFVDNGPNGTSPVSGYTSETPVPVSVAASGPRPSKPELCDKLRPPDFAGDIAPGPDSPFREPEDIMNVPESGDTLDATGPRSCG